MQSESQSESSEALSFELKNDKTRLTFREIEAPNQNLAQNRKYTEVIFFQNLLWFFGEEIKTISNILAFDTCASKWISIAIEAPSSKIFSEPSRCNICLDDSGFY